jgi:hypothetical protein
MTSLAASFCLHAPSRTEATCVMSVTSDIINDCGKLYL